jgi:asparagine synthase (glutamine-hydrolysing)
MCAIAGFSGFSDALPNLCSMLDSMHHRGPDSKGTFVEGNLYLGHNRLSILDLSNAGNQPMTSQDGNITIVFNGEIYNYLELRDLIPSGIILKSNSDTEVILELWCLFGAELFPMLRGMFAVAIWNTSKKELVLARDHMGIKPLYFYSKGTEIVFASEIKGMLASGFIEKVLDKNSIYQYLSNGYIIQTDTILDQVKMLPPSSYMVWRSGESVFQNFWNITDELQTQPLTEEESIKKVYQLVNEAVKEELVADRPIGVFLSGGLDSAVLLAALNNGGCNQIKTFSIGFEESNLSEHIQAKKIAEFYQTEHYQFQVSEGDIVPFINEYIYALDQPSLDGLNTWLVSKFASEHMVVGLSGLGGDEVFSGYGIDRLILQKEKYKYLFQLINKTKCLFKFFPKSIAKRIEVYSNWRDLPAFYKTWGRIFNDDEITLLTKSEIEHKNQFVKIHLNPKYNLLKRLSYMHFRGFMMSRLLRDSDAVSMSQSIEIRFPLIDYRLVNLVWNLPNSWKVKKVNETARLKNYEQDNGYDANGVKHLLYQAFKNDLPPLFGLLPKRGFKMPIEKWMSEGLKMDIRDVLCNEHSFLDSQVLSMYYHSWDNGKIEWPKVWALYTLEKWVSQNLK